MQPIPAPNNGNDMQPIPAPPQDTTNTITPVPPPQVVRRPSNPCGGESRIDDLILNGRCPAAQSLFRQLRSAGCRVSASDHFGTACSAP